MDHCKDKQKHKFVDPYNIGHVCEVCGKIAHRKTRTKASDNKGCFGKQGN